MRSKKTAQNLSGISRNRLCVEIPILNTKHKATRSKITLKNFSRIFRDYIFGSSAEIYCAYIEKALSDVYKTREQGKLKYGNGFDCADNCVGRFAMGPSIQRAAKTLANKVGGMDERN